MSALEENIYFAKMKFFKLFGNTIRIFDASESKLLLYVKQKAFKLKEEIIIYSDEEQSKPVFKINARSIIDFGATYDITDASSGARIGSLRRKGLMSTFVLDTWLILDANEKEIATIQEDSWIFALIRKYLLSIVPQKFEIKMGEKLVGVVKQTWNPFLPQMRVDFSSDTSRALDRKLGLSAVILLQCIEGKQQS
ncbi:MAG: hypothetical protein SFU98_02790 [Leptospiraceae bacterium]|nr:hypothetical protein [Leptospiraceae bacterium]